MNTSDYTSEIPYGYCHCGCGNKTPIARCTRNGYKAGEPAHFLPHHQITQPIDKRFWSKVAIGLPNDCWEWQAKCDKDGYGHFKVKGGENGKDGFHLVVASRFVWILTYGKIPDGLIVMHTCDNPPCCNPAHLKLGTYADNSQDRDNKKRRRITMAKLNQNQIDEIRSLYSAGQHRYI